MKKVLKCGQLFDANCGTVLQDMAVVIEENRITEVTPASRSVLQGCRGHRPFG